MMSDMIEMGLLLVVPGIAFVALGLYGLYAQFGLWAAYMALGVPATGLFLLWTLLDDTCDEKDLWDAGWSLVFFAAAVTALTGFVVLAQASMIFQLPDRSPSAIGSGIFQPLPSASGWGTTHTAAVVVSVVAGVAAAPFHRAAAKKVRAAGITACRALSSGWTRLALGAEKRERVEL